MFRVSTLDAVNMPRVGTGAGSGSGARIPGSEGPASRPETRNPEPDHTSAVDWAQDFFGKQAHLTVSGQLNVETYCMALSKVYTFGPTFRAENSNTSRHLAEFWMIEPEIAFADLAADAQLAEDMLKYLFKTVLEERADDMKFFVERIEKTAIDRLQHIIDKPFLRVTYTEGVRILEEAIKKGRKFEYPVKWGSDLQSEHERFLTEEHFKQPVILTNYPKGIKAFYMRLDDDCEPGRETVRAMDVLVPGIGEIIGGSQREERLDKLDARLDEMKLNKADYWWYRDLRRYGTVPHAGFGLGFERVIQFVTGMQNIRDVIPFPRAPKQAEF
jgi:asparaginyl-tRNA synthetase